MALSIDSSAVRASLSSTPVSRFVQSSTKLRCGVIVSLNGRRSGNAAAGSLRLVIARAGRDTVDVKEGEGRPSGDILPSGEWPENFSLLNYEDLSKHYEPGLFKPEAQPERMLVEVMSKIVQIASPEQSLEDVGHHFSEISGLPVVDASYRCLGVLSKKDLSNAGDSKAKVKDVMSSPAITLSVEKTVSDAAVLMLKNKVHRIPVVNEKQQVVGIVTRTDIFTALEGRA